MIIKIKRKIKEKKKAQELKEKKNSDPLLDVSRDGILASKTP